MERLEGLVAAVHTPMKADGSINPDQIGPVVGHMLDHRISGLYVLGSTGEGVSMTAEERREVAAEYVSAAAGRLPVIIQVGHNSVAQARNLAAHAQKIGADAISAVPPTYFKPADVDVLVDCLAEITADATISRGGCRVETRFGTIDQQFESQLKRIEEELTGEPAAVLSS